MKASCCRIGASCVSFKASTEQLRYRHGRRRDEQQVLECQVAELGEEAGIVLILHVRSSQIVSLQATPLIKMEF